MVIVGVLDLLLTGGRAAQVGLLGPKVGSRLYAVLHSLPVCKLG